MLQTHEVPDEIREFLVTKIPGIAKWDLASNTPQKERDPITEFSYTNSAIRQAQRSAESFREEAARRGPPVTPTPATRTPRCRSGDDVAERNPAHQTDNPALNRQLFPKSEFGEIIARLHAQSQEAERDLFGDKPKQEEEGGGADDDEEDNGTYYEEEADGTYYQEEADDGNRTLSEVEMLKRVKVFTLRPDEAKHHCDAMVLSLAERRLEEVAGPWDDGEPPPVQGREEGDLLQ